MKIKVLATSLSEKKGTIKTPQETITLDPMGVRGDAHAGSWHRQVSLLGVESIMKFSQEAGRDIAFGEFAENIATEGFLLYNMRPFDRLIGDQLELEVTQIGKKCHGDNCVIFREVGNCVMPKEGIFARVIRGGNIKAGDQLEYVPRQWKAMIVTLSDRASKGEYEDQSGPLLSKLVDRHFTENKRQLSVSTEIIPDSEEALAALIKKAEEQQFDLLITTGGTGIGPRDITPDVVRMHLDKEIPGIMEHIRTKYGEKIPNALLSRGVAGVIGKMLVFTLPGSPKAIKEYCDEIFKLLDHAWLMLYGIDGH
ncbi:MOSC domain-containing protein [Roseimarinus sediminis]|jgi:molybdenum cofactor synthesis domain-containing protein|uniref:MOSC domain-containing protein n=1 Tax=Roseimarinus sediminis TaxID=1610899 RepID=UPI003D225E45